ncbi:hypothetical protein MMC19_003173 [Ptychographa xylographoides]|nr:hypothetical protein [Ptychographa xylographoides]
MGSTTPAPLCAVVLLFCFLGLGSTHSWVEQLHVVGPNGTFTGNPGYIWGYAPRTAPNFNDALDLLLTPPNGRANQSYISPTDPICNAAAATMAQAPGFPMLQTPAGATIALQYQENGHVTLPNNQPGKPANRGTIYIYGTSQPRANEFLLTVHRNWTADGTGGDRRGKLLATQNFDDGQCYQVNNGNISTARQAQFKFTPTDPMGANLWCQNDVVLPSDIAGNYALYWVWDWPTAPGQPGLPLGKEELYSCGMSILVSPASNQSIPQEDAVEYAQQQPVNNAGVSSYIAAMTSGFNIFVTTPVQESLGQATQAVPQSPAAQTSRSPQIPAKAPARVTVYPFTTLLTTVSLQISPQQSPDPVPPTISPVSPTQASQSQLAATVTVTPTITVTLATSVPTIADPSTIPTSETVIPKSNCTTGQERRSRIIGLAKLRKA